MTARVYVATHSLPSCDLENTMLPTSPAPNRYEVDLDKNSANYAPLTPLGFIGWAAATCPSPRSAQIAVPFSPTCRLRRRLCS